MKKVKDLDLAALQKDLQEFVEQHGRRGWFRRNWLWFVPAILLTIVVGGGGAIYWAFYTRVYNLDVCQSAMVTIESDPRLQKALGDSIQPVKWPSREVAPNARVDENEIDVIWHVEGSKSRAKAHLQSKLRQGKWETIELKVTLANGKSLSLRDVGSSANEAAPFVYPGPAPATPPKSETKTPETKAPDINLIPPSDVPPGAK